MISAFSWQNSISLFPASFCSKAKFACYSRYLWTSYFCILDPYNENDIFFGCQFQKVLQIFIEPSNFSFFSISGWGIDLDYYDTERFALKMNRDHSVIFVSVPKQCISDSSADHDGYSISSKGFLPTVVDIMGHLSSPIPVHFSSLIPKMSMFTLAISCLTTSNFPYSWI